MAEKEAIALKEWSVVINALSKGEQILLMRKGGIAEETKDFKVLEPAFYLFPTYLHQKKELLKEKYQSSVDEEIANWDQNSKDIPIRYYAEVVKEIEIETIEQLNKLMPYHIWTENFAEGKLHWKKEKPLHVLMVRVYEIMQAHSIKFKDEYNGCKSWVSIDPPDGNVQLKPVLTDLEFINKQKEIESVLENF